MVYIRSTDLRSCQTNRLQLLSKDITGLLEHQEMVQKGV